MGKLGLKEAIKDLSQCHAETRLAGIQTLSNSESHSPNDHSVFPPKTTEGKEDKSGCCPYECI